MRHITTTTGREIALDGDLVAVMETLFHEVTAKRELEPSYENMNREIVHLVAQMTAEERSTYLIESLSLNSGQLRKRQARQLYAETGKESVGESRDLVKW